MKQLLVVLSVVLLLNQAGTAQASSINDGNDLARACATRIKILSNADRTDEEFFGLMVTMGLVQGIIRYHLLLDADNKTYTPYFCLPAGITELQSLKVMCKHLDEHPEQLHFSATNLFVLSLTKAFPCK